jgi:hypothetical protein
MFFKLVVVVVNSNAPCTATRTPLFNDLQYVFNVVDVDVNALDDASH